MVNPLLSIGVSPKVIDVFELGKEYSYSGLAVISAFDAPHDIPNCGYRIAFPNGEKLLYVTDCGSISHIEAKCYTMYAIEANHREQEIQRRAYEKLIKGEFAYEFRAASTHLSYEQAMDWLYRNMGPTSQYVLLHQHSETEKRTENA